MNNRYVFLLVVILISQSCIKNEESDSFQNYIGMKVDLKNINEECFSQNTNKIIIYFDSLDCLSCALDNAILWEKRTEELKQYQLTVLMLCDKPLFEEMCKYKDKYGIEFPLLTDISGEMVHNYPFLKKKQFKTFVLNSENRILWIGSPIYNEQVWSSFCKMMNLLKKDD